MSMSDPYIQDHLLEITVVECVKLKNTQWFTNQDPYVRLEYGGTKFRTRICSGGGTAPVFQEKFMFKLIQGLREINAGVWNHHRLSNDNLIGSGNIQLQDVLRRGYDDRRWTIQTQSGRYAGEVKLIMHYSQPNGGTPQITPPAAAIPPPYRDVAYPLVYPPPLLGYPTTTYPPPQIYPPPPQGYPTAAHGQCNRMYPAPPY